MAHKSTGLDENISLAGRPTTIREQWKLGKAHVMWVTLDLEKDPRSTEQFHISGADLKTLWEGGQR
jgi:hypothetical protein